MPPANPGFTFGDVAPDRVIADLSAILESARRLVGVTDLDLLLAEVLERACRIVGAERGSIFLVDDARGELVSRLAHQAREIRVPIGHGIAGHAAATRQTIVVEDAYADPRFNRQVDIATGFRTRQILAVPLVTEGERTVGVLQLLNKREGEFSIYDRQLAEAFTSQVAVILDRERLRRSELDRQRLADAMEVARIIHERLLPAHPPTHPQLDVAGASHPAEAAGGDYLDYLPLADGGIVMVIGDATGHGVGPALLMASVRATLHTLLHTTRDPGELLTRLNAQLARDTRSERFMTLLLLVIAPGARELAYAIAGHQPPLLLRRGEAIKLKGGGFPAGLFDDARFETLGPVALEPGDLLFAATDGIDEAASPTGERFGTQRILATLGDGDAAAAALLERVLDAETAFRAGRAPDDDRTILVVRVTS